jgi:hypothetical protein
MNLSFIPGDLHLHKDADGLYSITLGGEQVFTSKVEKRALAEYNKIRKEMETKYPARELTSEEKKKLLQQYVEEGKSGLNQLGRPKSVRKVKRGATRTFG